MAAIPNQTTSPLKSVESPLDGGFRIAWTSRIYDPLETKRQIIPYHFFGRPTAGFWPSQVWPGKRLSRDFLVYDPVDRMASDANKEFTPLYHAAGIMHHAFASSKADT
jgi:hypothetical protein